MDAAHRNKPANQSSPSELRLHSRSALALILASFAALFFELAIIRYLSTEIRIFAYLKNLALIASFFGIGLGMLLGKPVAILKRFFPIIAAALFFIINFAVTLRLVHLPIPTFDYRILGDLQLAPSGKWFLLWAIGRLFVYLTVVPGIMYLTVAFFTVLGGLIGERLKVFSALSGYGLNLAGSLAGIAGFTFLSYLGCAPAVWVFVGFLALTPFFLREYLILATFVLIVCVMAIPNGHPYWSPYYRIDLQAIAPPQGWTRIACYLVDVNHDYHQKMLDLSRSFVAKFPSAEPNHSGLSTYELPYQLVTHPGNVLVVGAGTGNDVAAALRHGAEHVDAVEIDPMILALGRRYHPELPYDSPRVSVYIDDARAFLEKSHQKYDLIIFGYLDSHTMVTSYSSIRLDNYVYTLESFREARSLLKDSGTMILAFGGGRTFLSDRLFATLNRAFDAPPRAYFTGYDATGVVFVEGKGAESVFNSSYPEISADLQAHLSSTVLATDHWPFLYLESRTIPFAIWSVLLLFLYFSYMVLQRHVPLQTLSSRQGFHLFFLGAGFMLLETKGVTELSLLFGSTWIVNALVVASFLVMGILANTLIIVRPVPRIAAYITLFLMLVAASFVPYSVFNGLPSVERILALATLASLPVFFSGIIFSHSFRDVENPAQALGINLLGAVIGGSLENLVMIGGTPILGILALLLYGLSAAFVPITAPFEEFSVAPTEAISPSIPE